MGAIPRICIVNVPNFKRVQRIRGVNKSKHHHLVITKVGFGHASSNLKRENKVPMGKFPPCFGSCHCREFLEESIMK